MFQLCPLILAGDIEQPAGKQQWLVRKAVGRICKKGTTGSGQRPYGFVTVGFGEDGCRTTGGVIAGLTFSFQQNNSARCRQEIGC